jgi:hypothetical protein
MTFPTVRLVDALLAACRKGLSERRMRRFDQFAARLGGYAVYALIVILVLTFGLAGLRAGEPGTALVGLVVIPAGIVLQYVALKMLSTVDRLIASSRTELTSSGFLDIVALLNLLGAVLAPLAGLFSAMALSDLGPMLSGLFVMALCGYVAALALSPGLVNVHTARSASIGQEAVGIVTFAMKSLYRFTPVGFGALSLLATVAAAVLLVRVAIGDAAGAGEIWGVVGLTLFAVLLPPVGYVAFVLLYLFVDLYRSIFLVAQVASLYRRQDPPAAPPQPQPPQATPPQRPVR